MTDSSKSASKAHPPRLSAAVSGTLVDVNIGPKHKTYRIHKALLIHYSEYFRNALRGQWTEAKDGVVTLSDVEPCIFDVFVEWLYTGNVPEGRSAWLLAIRSPMTKMDSPKAIFEYGVAKLKAYVLGDRLLAHQFRADSWHTWGAETCQAAYAIDTTTFCSLACFAYDNIPATSVVLQWFVDMLCENWETVGYEPENLLTQRELPHAFLLRVMRRHGELLAENAERIKMLLAEKTTPTKKAPSRPAVVSAPRTASSVPIQKTIYDRCYHEHENLEAQETCASGEMLGTTMYKRTHMKYDEKADYGFFE